MHHIHWLAYLLHTNIFLDLAWMLHMVVCDNFFLALWLIEIFILLYLRYAVLALGRSLLIWHFLVAIDGWVTPSETSLWAWLLRYPHYFIRYLTITFRVKYLVILPFAPVGIPLVRFVSAHVLHWSLGYYTALQSFGILTFVLYLGSTLCTTILNCVDIGCYVARLMLEIRRVIVCNSVNFQAISYRVLILLVNAQSIKACDVRLLEDTLK